MSRSKVLAGLSILAGVAVIASGAAIAQDAIAKRKELMKAVGGATKASSQMVKGEAPFDAAKAKASMDTIAGGWAEFAKLFPKGTESGGETTVVGASARRVWRQEAWAPSPARPSTLSTRIAFVVVDPQSVARM